MRKIAISPACFPGSTHAKVMLDGWNMLFKVFATTVLCMRPLGSFILFISPAWTYVSNSTEYAFQIKDELGFRLAG